MALLPGGWEGVHGGARGQRVQQSKDLEEAEHVTCPAACNKETTISSPSENVPFVKNKKPEH